MKTFIFLLSDGTFIRVPNCSSLEEAMRKLRETNSTSFIRGICCEETGKYVKVGLMHARFNEELEKALS